MVENMDQITLPNFAHPDGIGGMLAGDCLKSSFGYVTLSIFGWRKLHDV